MSEQEQLKMKLVDLEKQKRDIIEQQKQLAEQKKLLDEQEKLNDLEKMSEQEKIKRLTELLEKEKELNKKLERHISILKPFYARMREYIKENYWCIDMDKALIEAGIFKAIDENKTYKGFKGFENKNEVVDNVSAWVSLILKSKEDVK